MHKKILAICAALVALGALAIPAAASAAVTLTEHTLPGGGVDKVEDKSKIVAAGEEESIFAGGELTVKCNTNSMTGEVVKNNGTTVEGTVSSASFKGEESESRCNGGFLLGATRVKIPALESGGHWCVKNIAGEDRFEVIGAKCGTASGTLTFILEGSITCIYTRSSAVTGTFTTTTTPATLSVTGAPAFTKEAGSNFFCPSTGNINQMKFTLTTEGGIALSLDDIS